jgi:hypothetical protein
VRWLKDADVCLSFHEHNCIRLPIYVRDLITVAFLSSDVLDRTSLVATVRSYEQGRRKTINHEVCRRHNGVEKRTAGNIGMRRAGGSGIGRWLKKEQSKIVREIKCIKCNTAKPTIITDISHRTLLTVLKALYGQHGKPLMCS